jgi:hypothetical protein
MILDRRDLPILFRMAARPILLLVCFYIILNQQFPGEHTKWAIGMIGVVVGYWLK